MFAKKPVLGFVIVVFVFAGSIASGWSQAVTATLLGSVRDQSRAVLPGVTVTIRNLETQFTRTVITSNLGTYRASNLPVGEYEVSGTLPGFKTTRKSGISLTVGAEIVADLTLDIGEVSDEVVVIGGAQLVETSSATVSGLVDEQEIRALPLNGRDFLQLTTLQQGVQIMKAQRTGINPQTGNGINISISGGRPTQNNFRVDGISVNDHANSSPGSTTGNNLGVEALREFSVMTNTYSAEYGRSAGGVINAVTNSGSNLFHGTVFWFHRNDNLDARNFFDPGDLPEFRRQQYGVAAGGPIIEDRTFIFANYEGLREELATTSIATVMTAQTRAGNLLSGPIAVHPKVAPFLPLWPLPNGELLGDTGLFFAAPKRSTVEDYFVVRGDHRINDSVTLNGSYTYNDANVSEPESLLALRFLSPSTRHFVATELTQVINTHLVHSIRFGYNRSRSATGEAEAINPLADDPDLSFVFGNPPGIMNVSGIASFPGGPGGPDTEFYDFQSYQGYENVNYTIGRHNLKFGFNFEIIRDEMRSTNAENARWDFRSISNFLQNIPRRFRSQLPGSDTNRFIRQQVWGMYLQDDFQWKPTLTLNLGLRYEFATEPTERDGEASTFNTITALEPTVGMFFRNPSATNFGPRLGIAWDPTGAGKTSIRAGFGIFYDLILPFYLTDPGLRNPPFFRRVTTPSGIYDQGDFPEGGLQKLIDLNFTQFTADFIEIEAHTGYRMQYNLNVQHEIFPNTVLTAGYVGGRGVHLVRVPGDENVTDPIIRADGRITFDPDAPKPNPNFDRMRQWHFDGNSFYHALQLSLNRRWTENFRIQGSYSWAKSLDDGSATFTTNHYRNTSSSPYPPLREFQRGLSDFDIRHNLVINSTWDLPGSVEGGLGKLVNGWQLGGIFTGSTSIPFGVTIDGDRAQMQSNEPGQRPDVGPGGSTNPTVGNVNQWFNPNAFIWPEEGVLGNLGRNTLTSPKLASLDLNLVKNMPVPSISESFNIQFRLELYNVLNRANLDLPSETEIIDGDGDIVEDAGRITQTVTTNREIQLGLKVVW